MLAFVDLIFRFFHRLTRLTVHAAQSPHAKNHPHYSLSLEKEGEQFDEMVRLASVATHTEKFEGKHRGLGFKYQWLEKDGAERCFGMEKKRVMIGDDLIERKRLETIDLDKFASPWLILRDIDEPARLDF